MKKIFILMIALIPFFYNGCGEISVTKKQNSIVVCPSGATDCGWNEDFLGLPSRYRVNLVNYSEQALRSMLVKLYPNDARLFESGSIDDVEMRMGFDIPAAATELVLSQVYFEIRAIINGRDFVINSLSFSEQTLTTIPSINSFSPSFRNLESDGSLSDRILINGRYDSSTLEINSSPNISFTILGLGTLTFSNYENNMCDFLLSETQLFPDCSFTP